MAHKKAGGAKARQGGNVAGKRLGLKVASDSLVKPGQIIMRQRGRTIIPGENVGMGRDFTLFAKATGIVKFVNVRRDKKRVDVIEQS